MTFPLNVQQSVSFFSFLVSNDSFDRRAVMSSFRKIGALRCCVLCFCLNGKKQTSYHYVKRVREISQIITDH